MSSRVKRRVKRRGKRTRLALGILLLGPLLLAPGWVAAATSVAAPRAHAGLWGRGAGTAVAERSVLDQFGDYLSALTGGSRPAVSGVAIRPGLSLHPMHGGAGCGIGPNGVYHCT